MRRRSHPYRSRARRQLAQWGKSFPELRQGVGDPGQPAGLRAAERLPALLVGLAIKEAGSNAEAESRRLVPKGGTGENLLSERVGGLPSPVCQQAIGGASSFSSQAGVRGSPPPVKVPPASVGEGAPVGLVVLSHTIPH